MVRREGSNVLQADSQPIDSQFAPPTSTLINDRIRDEHVVAWTRVSMD